MNRPMYKDRVITSQNIIGRELEKGRFENTIFVDCKFKNTSFVSCFFDNVHFSGCTFDGVTVRNSSFKSCSFKLGTYGKERQVKFSACTFVTPTFDRVVAHKVVFDNRTSIVDGSFLGGSLHLKLKDCVISESAFGNTSLPKLEIEGSKLTGVSFRHTDLKQARVKNSMLTGVYFHRALTDHMTMFLGTVTGTTWSYSTLSDSVFTTVDFKETSILDSVCSTAIFDQCPGTAFLRVDGSYLGRSKVVKSDIPLAFIAPKGEFMAWTIVNGVMLEVLVLNGSKRIRTSSGRIYVNAVLTIEIHSRQKTVKQILPRPGKVRSFKKDKVTTSDEFNDDCFTPTPKGIPVYLTRIEAQRGYE